MAWTSVGGIVTTTAVGDFLLVACIVVVIKSFLIPAVRGYQDAKKRARSVGEVKKHWLYGSVKMFPQNEEGLMKRVASSFEKPVWTVNWFGPYISEVVIHHADLAITLLSSSAPKNNLVYGFFHPWIGDGLLTSSGRKWQRNRHLLTPAFHFSILKPYTNVSNACVRVMLDKWSKKVGTSMEIYLDVNLMTLDTILQCAMSTKSDCQNRSKKNEYIEAVHDVSKYIMSRVHKPLLHIDWIYWLTAEGRKFKQLVKVLHDQSEKVIRERRKTLENRKFEEESSGKKRLDFLDILLHTKDEDGKGLNDSEIRDEVDTFLFAGHDTTASGIAWALYNLAVNVDCQDKCREELKSVVGDKENIEWEDLSKLSYLTLCIKESLRLCPPVPFIGRELNEPLKFRSKLKEPNETTIDANSNIALHIFTLHRNVHVWDSPEEFIPERFKPENMKGRSPHAYLPFSAGPRNCIGQNFAMNEMKIAIGQTLRKFKVIPDESFPKPSITPQVVLRPKDGIFIKLMEI
uniref:cytochrome P450 4F1-like n=1 Tax=Ciona intestinalis TaxID=7719 RepID=UPI000180C4BF|nr:cytochrome P450 4F1-like [Ciona intestinalis]|eukprot:XP_002124012.1 cytochrome P450 4F1-like [Ciona intestinalis]